MQQTGQQHANGVLEVQQAGSQRTTYSWDFENMCVRVQQPSGALITCVYDGDLKQRFEHDSAGSRYFGHDGENVGLELDYSASLVAAYVMEPAGGACPERQRRGDLISERRPQVGASAWYLCDALGTADRLVGPQEGVLISFVHSAFGIPEAVGGPYPQYPTRYRWLGRLGYRWEPDTNQYDVRRRRYDPARGRWVSRDPLVPYPWYGYAGGNPVLLSDPSGMWGPAIHAGKTTQWAESLGFGAGPSAAIAAADVQVDNKKWSGYRRAYHEKLVTGDFRRKIAAEDLEAAKAAAKRGDCKAVWENLGHGLHALQDISAHGDYPIHWGEWLDDPTKDIHGNPDPGQSRVHQAFQETKAYLKSALADPSIKCCLEIAKHQAAKKRCPCVKSKKP